MICQIHLSDTFNYLLAGYAEQRRDARVDLVLSHRALHHAALFRLVQSLAKRIG